MVKLVCALGFLSGKRGGIEFQTVQSYFCQKFRVEEKLAASSLTATDINMEEK